MTAGPELLLPRGEAPLIVVPCAASAQSKSIVVQSGLKVSSMPMLWRQALTMGVRTFSASPLPHMLAMRVREMWFGHPSNRFAGMPFNRKKSAT